MKPQFKLTYRRAAVLAYCAVMNKDIDVGKDHIKKSHKRAMEVGVEVLRLTSDPKTWDEKEAGVQLVRDLMLAGLLNLPIEVTITKGKRT